MSSNINLVDKLNPISFEQNEQLKFKINPKILQYVNENNEDDNENQDPNDSKVTISLSATEQDLIELEKLHNKYLKDIENIENQYQEQRGIKIENSDKANTENSLKKKLLLNLFKNLFINPSLNLL